MPTYINTCIHTYIKRLSTTLRYSIHAYMHSNFTNINDGRISKNSGIASSSYKYTHTYMHTYMYGHGSKVDGIVSMRREIYVCKYVCMYISEALACRGQVRLAFLSHPTVCIMFMLSVSGAALTSGWSPSAGQSSNRRHSSIWSPGRWAETGWSEHS